MCTVTDFLSNLFYKLDEGSASTSTQSMPLSEGCFHARTCDHAKTRLDCLLKCFFFSSTEQRKHQSFASLAFVGESTGHRWIPLTKGQKRGKCSHLKTSSWFRPGFGILSVVCTILFSFDKIVYCDMHFTFNSIEFDFVNNPHGQ